MSGFISKQPNGQYCRFSTVVEAPTHWNMSRADYIDHCVEKAKAEAEDVLDNYLKPFEMIINLTTNLNMTGAELEQFKKDVGWRGGRR